MRRDASCLLAVRRAVELRWHPPEVARACERLYVHFLITYE